MCVHERVCVCVYVCVCVRSVCVQHKNHPIRRQGGICRQRVRAKEKWSLWKQEASGLTASLTDRGMYGQPEFVGCLCDALQKAGSAGQTLFMSSLFMRRETI